MSLKPPFTALTEALAELVAHIPRSQESVQEEPKEKALGIARAAALRAAGISGTLALPPGPLGLATILPDLVAIWRVQQGMVADIAAIYGKSSILKEEAMIYCLFRHGGAALMRDLVARAGERFIVRRGAASAIQTILQKVGLRVSQRLVSKSLSRFIPIVGALGVGAYAYYDTTQVAATAIELFSKEIELLPLPGPHGSLDAVRD